MNENEKELMERYIYQVVRHLHREQRHEVSLVLQELIGDMWEESQSMEEVLTRLGDPRKFAGKYQDSSHYLIGPEYYDSYTWLLKIVLICTAVTLLVVSVLEGIWSAGEMTEISGAAVWIETIRRIGAGIGNLLATCVGVFGGITLLFAILERCQVKLELKKEAEWTVRNLQGDSAGGKRIWTPDYLAPVPDKKAVISRGDSIVGIVFIVIFGVLLIFTPELFSAILMEDGNRVTVPALNLEQWDRILPVFVLLLVIGLGDEMVRLIKGHYCRLVMICNSISGILQIVLSVILLKVLPFWNPDFTVEVQAGELVNQNAEFLTMWWNTSVFSNVLLAFVIMVTLAEVGTTIYKTLRYGTDQKKGREFF